MQVLQAIDTRRSALRLTGPGPDRADLERILTAGVRAPDHGRLAPWRFRVLEGDARHVLGEALAGFTRRTKPDATADQIEAARAKALRAPVVVVVAARTVAVPKVPEIEQLLAVGAAVQNMCLAAHALGFGAMWKTGAPTYDAGVVQALGLQAGDRIVAFLYLGNVQAPGPVRPAVLDGCVRWD